MPEHIRQDVVGGGIRHRLVHRYSGVSLLIGSRNGLSRHPVRWSFQPGDPAKEVVDAGLSEQREESIPGFLLAVGGLHR
jgi:hypothetical protein